MGGPTLPLGGPALRRVCRLLRAPVAVSSDFVWPAPSDIRDAQAEALALVPSVCTRASSELLVFPSGSFWVPDLATALQLRLLIDAHCGPAGHRSFSVTLSSLSLHFSWTTIEDDTSTFFNTCIHCLCTTGGRRIPRPFGEAVHASKPNEVIHFDSLYIGPASQDVTYLLLLKDDASGFVWLHPHARP